MVYNQLVRQSLLHAGHVLARVRLCLDRSSDRLPIHSDLEDLGREGVVVFLIVRRHRRSVFHAHTDHDEHRIVLLRAALDWGHRSPWSNWKRSLLHVCRRTRSITRRRSIAR